MAEQLRQLVGGPAQAIHVRTHHPFLECLVSLTDDGDVRLQHGCQAQLMLAGEAAHEALNLVLLAEWTGPRSRRIWRPVDRAP